MRRRPAWLPATSLDSPTVRLQKFNTENDLPAANNMAQAILDVEMSMTGHATGFTQPLHTLSNRAAVAGLQLNEDSRR